VTAACRDPDAPSPVSARVPIHPATADAHCRMCGTHSVTKLYESARAKSWWRAARPERMRCVCRKSGLFSVHGGCGAVYYELPLYALTT